MISIEDECSSRVVGPDTPSEVMWRNWTTVIDAFIADLRFRTPVMRSSELEDCRRDCWRDCWRALIDECFAHLLGEDLVVYRDPEGQIRLKFKKKNEIIYMRARRATWRTRPAFGQPGHRPRVVTGAAMHYSGHE